MNELIIKIKNGLYGLYGSKQNEKIIIDKNMLINFFLILLPVYVILINGYQFGKFDNEAYMSEVINKANPSFFHNDHLFNEPSGKCNFWIPVMAMLSRYFDLEKLCFAGYLLSVFIIFWAIYHISLNIFKSRASALMSVLLLLTNRGVGATMDRTFDIIFSMRIMPLALSLVAVLFLMRNRLVLASFLSGLAFILHPLTPIPIIFIILYRAVVSGVVFGYRKFIEPTAVLFMTILPLLLKVYLLSNTAPYSIKLFSIYSDTYIKLIKWRLPYLFVSTWHVATIISVISITLILGLFLLYRKKRCNSIDLDAIEMFFVCIALFVMGFIFADLLKWQLILLIQLFRSFLFIILFTQIYLAHYILQAGLGAYESINNSNEHSPIKSAYFFMLILSLVSLIILMISLHSPNFLTIYIAVILLALNYLDLKDLSAKYSITINFLCIICILIYYNMTEKNELFLQTSLVISLASFLFITIFKVTNRFGKKILVIVLLLGVNLFYLKNIFSSSLDAGFGGNIDLPGKSVKDPLSEVGYWCRDNTPQEAVFAVNSNLRYFRIYSKRSIIVNWKEGTRLIFTENYAKEWFRRMTDLKDFESINEDGFRKLKAKYKSSYTVTSKKQRLGFPLMFKNNEYNVYRID